MTMRQQLAQQYGTSNNLQARIAMHERFSTNPQDWVDWLWDVMQLPSAGAWRWHWAFMARASPAFGPIAN